MVTRVMTSGASMRSQFVQAGAIRLHVVAYGGQGPPLLAVHGTGLVAQVWGVMVPYLRPHFRVIALDRRGHGASDQPADGYEIEANAADYAAVVEQLGLADAVAIGHSSGGTSLGVAAARWPGLVRRLAMVDPILFPPQTAGAAPPTAGAATMVERTRRRRAEWPSATAMFEDLAGKATFANWRAEALWDYVHHGAHERADGTVALTCPPELEARMYGHASRIDLLAEMARIPVPVLIVRGGESDRLPRSMAQRAAGLMPAGRLVEMPGLGHFPPMADPAGLARLVVPFLRDGAEPPAG